MVPFSNPGRNAIDGSLRWQQQLSPHGNGLAGATPAASDSTSASSSASPALQPGSNGGSNNRSNHAQMNNKGPPGYSGSNSQLSGPAAKQQRLQNSWSDSSTLNLLSDTAARQADEDHSGPSSRRASQSPTSADKAMGSGSIHNGRPAKRTLEGHKKEPSSASLTAEADSSLSYSRGQSDSDHDGASPSDGNAEAIEEEKRKKRTKTARACDSCRRKKIRCDVIDDGSPAPGDPNNGNGGLTCAHCRQYGFSCTFFLPITETRFKKKREREAEAAAAAAASRFPHGGSGGMFAAGGGSRSGVSPHGSAGSPLGPSLHASVSAAQEWPPRSHNHLSASWDGRAADHSSGSPAIAMAHIGQGAGPVAQSLGQRLDRLAPPMSNDPGPPPGGGQGQPPDTRVLGPTSLAYIVHSTAFVPGSAIEAHDLKHSQTFEVGASGDGIIKLNRSRHRHPSLGSSAEEEDDTAIPQIPDAVRGRLTGDVAEKLINSYFEKIGYLWPVVTKSEFLHLSHPPPLLFYAICGVAALDRNVPIEVLSAVRTGLNAIFKDSDVLSNSSALTVKALLILSLHSDIHGSANLQSGTRLWNRLGIALRMAQDLGLHRDASGRDDLDEFAHFLEQKRRIWGACVSADRCVSIALGHPLAIDLTDCDVRLPSPYEIQRFPTDLPSISGVERPFAFNTEMLKLSILFGRVQKTIYSPTGLMKATDDEIAGLLNDIDQWRERLPEELHFTGPTSSPPAGILHLSHACIQMLFFRVFMRISYSCPQHLKFSLTIERMTSMVKWSRESIAWVDVSGDIYFDTMQFISYALVFCATIQYHSWIRRGDEEGLKALAKLKEIFTRGRHQDGQKQDMSLRAKTAEIVSLLCEAAQGHWANTPSTGNLNPTAGVVNRRTVDSVKGITWKNAPGRPGGGVFEAADASLLLGDLPNGTIILGSNRTPALVMTSANGWQPVPGVLPEQHLNSGLDQSSDSTDLPDLSNFTYLGGSVWQDESGRPVDRRGSGLMVVLPTSNQSIGEQMGLPFQQLQMQQQQHQQHSQNDHQQQQQHHQQYTNVNPHLNHLSAVDQAFAAQQHTTPLSSLLGGDAGQGGGIPGAGAGNYTLENLFGSGTGTPGGLGSMGFGGGGAGAGGGANLAMGVPADPMMLNDPLMGILDWQAWQSYLAPFSNSNNQNNGGNQNSNNPNGHSSGSAGATGGIWHGGGGGGGRGGLVPGEGGAGGAGAASGRSPAQSHAHGIGSGAA